MRIIALSAPPTYVLTQFGVIISSQDVNIGISSQVASGRLDTHLILTRPAGMEHCIISNFLVLLKAHPQGWKWCHG
jgi:hypothetical protein